MKTFSLFDIPIYSMPKKEFEKRWEKFINKRVNDYVSHGWEEDKARTSIYQTYHPQHIWKYNQIIGYISISGSKNDIWIDLFIPERKKAYARSTKKHFIIDQMLNGCHFRIHREYTNMTIFLKIKEMIEGTVKDCDKDRFIDWTTFLNIGPHIDWIKIIQEKSESKAVLE